jgi:hypothetical protein
MKKKEKEAQNEAEIMKENSRFRFIGKEGLENLLKSENKEQYIDKYNLASKLFEYGYDPMYIKKKSGWEIGADGKWRYEIDDRGLNVKYYPMTRMEEEHPQLYRAFKNYYSKGSDKSDPELKKKVEKFYAEIKKFMNEKPKLPEVISDGVFFDAYPEFRDVKVEYKNYTKRPCVYDKRKKTFYVDKSMLGTEVLNIHAAAEMQRMIQDYEGFSKAYPMNKVLPDDIYDTAMKPIDKSDFFRFTTKEGYLDPAGRYERKENYRKLYGFDHNEIPEEQSLREDFILSTINGYETAQSGNVEARNVMNRFDYDNKMRRNSLAEETEDIFRGLQVSPKSISDMHRLLKGPIDIINEMKKNLQNNAPRRNKDWELYN